MHKLTFNIFKLIVITIITIGIYSCSKSDDAGTPPYIFFKKGAGYTFTDTVAPKGSKIKIGIVTWPSHMGDSLVKFTVLRTYDNTYDSLIFDHQILAPDADSFLQDFEYTLRDTVAKEKYTFTITNKNNVSNSIKIIIKTH